jgi:hypothetical protein
MKNITILLPIYKLEDDDKLMLNNAINSVKPFSEEVLLRIVCPVSLTNELETFQKSHEWGDLDVLPFYNTTTNSDFTAQINFGIDNCSTEWFSILEIDDEYKEGWLKLVNEYTEVYKDVEVFLPIIEDVNVEGKFIGFTNESLWAYGFTEKQGFLDNAILIDFQNFQTSGGLFKTESIKKYGSFKDNIKLTFLYEFLLRLTHNGTIIMGIPKIGYRHVNFRENSLFWKYKNDENLKLTDKEVKFWIETAKKEFFFKNKRDIIYAE